MSDPVVMTEIDRIKAAACHPENWKAVQPRKRRQRTLSGLVAGCAAPVRLK
jgi:hypothetical protein